MSQSSSALGAEFRWARWLTKLKNRNTCDQDTNGRDIINRWLATHCPMGAKVLDVGCGEGLDLLSLAETCPQVSLQLYGIDILPAHVEMCRRQGITAAVANLEHEKIPFPEVFDVVIANQVFEHLKNWVWAVMQIGLRLKPGGLLVVGVPNLASLHNRILLLLGQQPTCIRTHGMHVRGFTLPGLRAVLEYEGVFQVEEVAGQPFYPFPRSLSRLLCRLFPEAAASVFLLCRKTGDAHRLASIESVARQGEFRLR